MSQPYDPPPGAAGRDPQGPAWPAHHPAAQNPAAQYPAAQYPAARYPAAWPAAYAWPAAGGPSYAVPPVPPRRKRLVVAAVAGAVLLGIGLVVVVAMAGLGIGRSAGDALGAGFPGMAVPTTSAPSDSSVLGADPGLDPYAERCEAGEMRACDELSFLADPESGYERYGQTCGGRVDVLEVPQCVLLD